MFTSWMHCAMLFVKNTNTVERPSSVTWVLGTSAWLYFSPQRWLHVGNIEDSCRLIHLPYTVCVCGSPTHWRTDCLVFVFFSWVISGKVKTMCRKAAHSVYESISRADFHSLTWILSLASKNVKAKWAVGTWALNVVYRIRTSACLLLFDFACLWTPVPVNMAGCQSEMTCSPDHNHPCGYPPFSFWVSFKKASHM